MTRPFVPACGDWSKVLVPTFNEGRRKSFLCNFQRTIAEKSIVRHDEKVRVSPGKSVNGVAGSRRNKGRWGTTTKTKDLPRSCEECCQTQCRKRVSAGGE